MGGGGEAFGKHCFFFCCFFFCFFSFLYFLFFFLFYNFMLSLFFCFISNQEQQKVWMFVFHIFYFFLEILCVKESTCCSTPHSHQQNIVHTHARTHTHPPKHTMQLAKCIRTMPPTVSHHLHQHIANYSQVLLILKPRVTGQPRVKWSVFFFLFSYFPHPPPKIFVLFIFILKWKA